MLLNKLSRIVHAIICFLFVRADSGPSVLSGRAPVAIHDPEGKTKKPTARKPTNRTFNKQNPAKVNILINGQNVWF